MAKRVTQKGRIVLTIAELQDLLGLPDEIEITSVVQDTNRDKVHIVFRSEGIVPKLTFDVLSGQEIPITSLD